MCDVVELLELSPFLRRMNNSLGLGFLALLLVSK